jgi:hypothetical protein
MYVLVLVLLDFSIITLTLLYGRIRIWTSIKRSDPDRHQNNYDQQQLIPDCLRSLALRTKVLSAVNISNALGMFLPPLETCERRIAFLLHK